MNTVDYITIGCYFLIIAGIVVYITVIERRGKGQLDNTSGYFLGGKDLGWVVIGASLFASNIGTEHLIGLAGAGAAGDFAAAQFELIACFALLALGWVFVPFYLKTGVYTMPEFLEKRYDGWARGYLTYVSIVGYILTKISVTIAAGGIIFTTLLGVDFWTGSLIIVVLTGAYTLFGGLKAVVWTDFVQLIVLGIGSISLTYFAYREIGGWEHVVFNVTPQHLSLWRPMDDADFPWTGIILGAPILGVWYWCTDQFIVQRVLAAKNVDHARKGTIFAGFLKLLPLFFFVLPGVLTFALVNAGHETLTFPREDGITGYDAALPMLTMNVLPVGLRGLVVSGLIAALMSSLSSVFNSCSTLITLDVYKKYKPMATEKQLVRVGQISTLILIVLGLSWIPLLKLIEGGLFQKLQSIQAYISPPIAAVFLVGIMSKRVNSRGAKWALITGLVLGSARLLLELSKDKLSGILYQFTDINFLHFAIGLFSVCLMALFLGSSKESLTEEKSSLVMKPLQWKASEVNINTWLSAAVVVAVVILWVYFR